MNPMGEGISAGMESGYCAASAVMEHFDNPETVREAYRQSTENLKSYMQRQWSLVGGMAGTFREVGNMLCHLVIDLNKGLCTKSGVWTKFVQR